jgi:hypothetical protein
MDAIRYKLLIDTYLTGLMSAEQFVLEFNNLFLVETNLDYPLYEILESIFEDGEAYSPLWSIEDEDDFHITENTFHLLVLSNCQKLNAYIAAQQ